MGHTLLHQVLLADLVVPVMLAQAPEHQSKTRFGARLGERTWLRPDLVVARQEQFPRDRPHVTGTPLLVVEIASAASLTRDLGAKRDLWARFGVPAYWVVHLDGDDLTLYVFELDEDGYLVETARLGWGESCWVTEPFKLELVPDLLFESLPRTLVNHWRGTMASQPGLDMPAADEEILADVFGARWPTGAEKTELEDGCPVFYGVWDERDVAIAERAYPGRWVRLDQEPGEPGTLRVLPAFEGLSDSVRSGTNWAGTVMAADTEEIPNLIRIRVPGE